MSGKVNTPKLYEISALVSYHVVIRANSEKEALGHVDTWEHAWDSNADLVSVSDVELVAVREGSAEDAHLDISATSKPEDCAND